MQFYITARCNLACEQCNIIYANADSAELSIDKIRGIAANLAEIGVGIVLLIGGEPFVRADLPEIVGAFTEHGIHVRLQTNGLASRAALEACVKAGAKDISISLDSLDPLVQDKINGGFESSWARAIKTIATVNEIFPENGSAFFGTVLMPRNLEHVRDVLEFATAIGWGMSLVPAHTTLPERPLGFRAFDDENVCRFDENMYPRVREVLDELKRGRDQGLNLYDSDEYIDDIYRFVAGMPLRWRRRNNDTCDSPNLYFALEPNGNISPCCDFKLVNSYPAYDSRFPEWYRDGRIHAEVYGFTKSCSGCMYGSYPEITVTARYMRSFLRRIVYFNGQTPKLKKLTPTEMLNMAAEIRARRNI